MNRLSRLQSYYLIPKSGKYVSIRLQPSHSILTDSKTMIQNHVRSYEYRIDKFLQKKIVIFEIVSLKWEFLEEFQLSEGFYGFCVSVLICHIENPHTICILILACFWSTYFYKLYFLWRACIRNCDK